MPMQFRTIGIMGRVKNSGVIETFNALIQYLQKLNCNILVEKETATSLSNLDTSLVILSKHELHQQCDLLIVIGGDGSLLNAIHSMTKETIPVLGIHRGRLGFLTDIHPNHLERIKSILEGHYILDERFLLTATVIYHEKILGQSDALNEIALIPDSIPHMNEFEIYIDNQFVCSQHSDGLIIATPTGSTAYALSGGGPILHPKLDAIVLVPMFPHTLSIRPIVIEGNQQIRIVITPNNNATPRIACDGQAFISTPPNSEIIIHKKTQRLHLIHPTDYEYYETLRSKLHWGRKLQ
jgi:NAD+ kinase